MSDHLKTELSDLFQKITDNADALQNRVTELEADLCMERVKFSCLETEYAEYKRQTEVDANLIANLQKLLEGYVKDCMPEPVAKKRPVARISPVTEVSVFTQSGQQFK
jgi:hypothetical protein